MSGLGGQRSRNGDRWTMKKGPLLGGSSQDLVQWLITMVIVSPLNGVMPLINGLFMAYKWRLLTTY